MTLAALRQARLARQPARCSNSYRHASGNVFLAVDAIGIVRHCMDTRVAIDGQTYGEQALDMAPAAAWARTVTVVPPADSSTQGAVNG